MHLVLRASRLLGLCAHTGNDHVLQRGPVKAVQSLDMLDMSVVLCVQESVVQWFKDSDEGTSPS